MRSLEVILFDRAMVCTILNFSSCLEQSLKFTTLSIHVIPFSVKFDYFVGENLAHPHCKNL